MKDRISQNPGRVLVKPENGGANFYATLERADNPIQEGDALNKANLLTDKTASLLGLGENAVPDDAFGKLSEINLHWWKRQGEYEGYKENRSELASSKTDARIAYHSSSATATSTIYYCDSYTMGEGVFTMNNPQTLTISWDTYTDAEVLKGKYYNKTATENADKLIYVPTEAVIYQDTENAGYGVRVSGGIELKSVYTEWTETEYVFSADRNAYPDSGTEGIFSYQYLGVPFENAREGAKIVTGSYVGVGTFGANNPNSLTFDNMPRMILMLYNVNTNGVPSPIFYSGGSNSTYFAIIPKILTTTYASNLGFANSASGGGSMAKISADGKTITWYNTGNAQIQCNNSGVTYHYACIY